MESTESAISFDRYLVILKRRWFPASVVFLLVMSLTVFNTLRQKPMYQADAKLSFKRTNPTSSITGLGKEIGEMQSLIQENNPINDEVELIKSEPIVRETINKLQLKDRKGSILKVKDFFKQLGVSPIQGADILIISYRDEDPKKAFMVVNTMLELYLDATQKINRAEAASAREFIEQQLPKAEASVRKAEADLRSFKEQNNVVSLEEEAKSAVQVMGGLQTKITEARSALADANGETEAFKKELQMNTQEALVITSLSQSSAVQEALKNYQQIQQQLNLERTRFQETHPVIVDLKQKEFNFKSNLDRQIQQFSGKSTQTYNNNLQIGEVKPKLIEEFVKIEAKRQGLVNQVATLSNEEALYKQRVSILPKLEKQQRELESKLQAAQSSYSLLLQKQHEIGISENQNINNVRIFQPPYLPEEPLASRKFLSVVAGIFLGSMLALITAIVLESKDKYIRSVEEAKEILGFPLLAVIPSHKKSQKLAWGEKRTGIEFINKKPDNKLKHHGLQTTLEIVTRDIPDSSTSAAYRMLYNNLRFLNSDRNIKTIVVTSCVPTEGKSTICANLAAAVAQLGRQVLIVDANMLHPLQHQIWQVSDRVGLSDVVVDQRELKTAIKEVMLNVDLLTSGVISSDSASVLESAKISSLLEKFARNYDLALVDACSLNNSVDALMLGKMADGILLVTRLGVVDFDSANFAKDILHKSGQNVLGMVVGFPSEK